MQTRSSTTKACEGSIKKGESEDPPPLPHVFSPLPLQGMHSAEEDVAALQPLRGVTTCSSGSNNLFAEEDLTPRMRERCTVTGMSTPGALHTHVSTAVETSAERQPVKVKSSATAARAERTASVCRVHPQPQPRCPHPPPSPTLGAQTSPHCVPHPSTSLRNAGKEGDGIPDTLATLLRLYLPPTPATVRTAKAAKPTDESSRSAADVPTPVAPQDTVSAEDFQQQWCRLLPSHWRRPRD
jgi:hypothetical protein